MTDAFYTLSEPTERFVGPVQRFSYSALSSIRTCALRWQLERSRYGTHPRLPTRPSAAALTGTIIHETLERMLRALAAAGNPDRGSAAFREAIAGVRPLEHIGASLTQTRAELAAHPRAAGFALRETPIALYRAASVMFQRAYRADSASSASDDDNTEVEEAIRAWSGAPDTSAQHSAHDGAALMARLRARGALAECHITHPTLPLHGYIDLVTIDPNGAVTLSDFKTGRRSPTHHDQLTLYALMWWRATGQLPASGVLRYVRSEERVTFEAEALERCEAETRAAMRDANAALAQAPAPATLGAGCRWCSARPFCGLYLRDMAARHAAGEAVRDLTLRVVSAERGGGAMAETEAGVTVGLVWRGRPPHEGRWVTPGARVRVLDAQPADGGLMLTARTEVFWDLDVGGA